MKPTPQDALAAIVALLSRQVMSPAESIGARICVDIIKATIDPQPPVKSD